MYDPNDMNRRNGGEEFDISEISEHIGEHVERELENRRPIESDDEHRSYSDAGYILSDEAPTTPRRYYTPPEKEQKPPRQTGSEPPKKRGAGRIFAGLCAGLLLGTVIGVGVSGMMFSDEPAAADASSSPEASSEPAPTPTPVLSIDTSSSGEMDPTDIYNLATSQAVGIRTEITGYNIFGMQTTNAVSGTGFIVSEDGYIITNYHVIEDAYQGGYDVNVITYTGETYVAEIVGFENEGSDIAVLKIDATGLTPVKLGDSSQMEVGESVYAVGNPLGELTYTMTSGMVSALDREVTTSDQSTGEINTINMFQIDAAVNSGNSGGPLYSSRGEVIGVVSAKYSETGVEGLAFAIPINDAVDIANDLITQGYVSGKPYMGITVQTMPQKVAAYYNVPDGAYVYYIESGACGERAGLELGDIITKIDDIDVNSSSDLQNAKKNYRADDTATLTVYRDGQYIELQITFDEQRQPVETSAQNYYDYYPFGYFDGDAAANF